MQNQLNLSSLGYLLPFALINNNSGEDLSSNPYIDIALLHTLRQICLLSNNTFDLLNLQHLEITVQADNDFYSQTKEVSPSFNLTIFSSNDVNFR